MRRKTESLVHILNIKFYLNLSEVRANLSCEQREKSHETSDIKAVQYYDTEVKASSVINEETCVV